MERLDKWLCAAGVGSRSQARDMVRSGRVTVDGEAVRQPERKISGENAVCLDGIPLQDKRRTVVLLLNKPAGYVTSTSDPNDPTVMELLPEAYRSLGLVPVGRLDKQTEGLLLFTNDGALSHNLISPKKAVEKIYYARHEGTATAADCEAFAQGLTLRDETACLPAKLEPLGAGESLITVCEGKYHQVRRMMAARGMHVTYLERRQEGGLTLENLPRGQVRELQDREILELLAK